MKKPDVRRRGLRLAGLLLLAPVSWASAQTVLPLPPGYPNLLGESCGGVHTASYVTGFDANGHVTGEVYAWTTCGGSGRGGGYHQTTYQSWNSILWDLQGNYKQLPYDGVMPDPRFTAADAYGNTIYSACNGTTNGQPACTAESTIVYVPPTPPVSVTVPSLYGLTAAQALSSLTTLGLVESATKQCNNYYKRGTIAAQAPAAGTVVDPGTAVSVVISKGTCPN